MIPLFKALVRPLLEYGNAVWNPNLCKYINQIENMQRQFTKRIIGMGDLNYEERLKSMKLPSLEYRRLRGELIEVYKILNNYLTVTTLQLLNAFCY